MFFFCVRISLSHSHITRVSKTTYNRSLLLNYFLLTTSLYTWYEEILNIWVVSAFWDSCNTYFLYIYIYIYIYTLLFSHSRSLFLFLWRLHENSIHDVIMFSFDMNAGNQSNRSLRRCVPNPPRWVCVFERGKSFLLLFLRSLLLLHILSFKWICECVLLSYFTFTSHRSLFLLLSILSPHSHSLLTILKRLRGQDRNRDRVE